MKEIFDAGTVRNKANRISFIEIGHANHIS